jgi:vacuolar protein sorting-associated protein IST1
MHFRDAISNLIFAFLLCADLPELLQIHSLFTTKYGEEFAAAAACELCPDCGMRKTIHSMWCFLPRPDLINVSEFLALVYFGVHQALCFVIWRMW